MDRCLDFMVTEFVTVPGLRVEEPSFRWGGEEHSQGAAVYHWGHRVRFVRGEPPSVVWRLLPPAYRSMDWNYFSLEGEALAGWRAESCGLSVEWGGDGLEDFFRATFAGRTGWAIVCLDRCEEADVSYELDLEAGLAKAREFLRDDRDFRGFVVFGPGHAAPE